MKNEDKTVEVEIDLPDEIIVSLALEAHDRKITLNDLMVELIRDYLNSVKESVETD